MRVIFDVSCTEWVFLTALFQIQRAQQLYCPRLTDLTGSWISCFTKLFKADEEPDLDQSWSACFF